MAQWQLRNVKCSLSLSKWSERPQCPDREGVGRGIIESEVLPEPLILEVVARATGLKPGGVEPSMEGPEACREIVWAAVGSALRKRHTVQASQASGELDHCSLLGGIKWLEGRHRGPPSPVLALLPGGPCAGLHLPHPSEQLGEVLVLTHSSPTGALPVAETRSGPGKASGANL